MGGRDLDVPASLRQKASALGPGAARWLAGLGPLIDALERDWEVTVGSPLAGATEAYIAEATRRDGVVAVVKLAMPDAGPGTFVSELHTLLLADGNGCARVLEHDETRGALLLERLGRPLAELGLPVKAQIEIICATLQRLWSAAPDVPDGMPIPSGADKAGWLGEFIARTWEELDRPCSERVVARSLAFADSRQVAFDAERAVLVHGDAHSFNTLEDPPARRFKFVDPDGVVSERAHDLAISMREWNAELLAGDAVGIGRERCALLGRLTGVEPRPIWEWGFIERVSSGLFGVKCRFAGARECLEVAERWVDFAP
jgi:streptomycin 6-kinase